MVRDVSRGTVAAMLYLRNSAGELALAPVSIGERLYQLRTQGMGGKGTNEAAKNWSSQADFSTFYQSQQQKLQALSTQLAKRRPGITINLSAENLSYMDLTRVLVATKTLLMLIYKGPI